MLTRFQGNSEILDSKPFIDEEVRFNLMHLIREGHSSILFRNETNTAIIGQSGPSFPAWVWTVEGIGQKELDELKEDFYQFFKDAEKLSFIAKPEIAEILSDYYSSKRGVDYTISMRMESFHCPTIIPPRNNSGELSRPTLDDAEVIAQFFCGFIKDGFGVDTTVEKQMENAKKYITSSNFYVWRDEAEIVSMAYIPHRSKRHGRINQVYTKPEMRGKGYAAMIVSELSKIIDNESLTPILFTDLANPSSNKAYKNVGFIECGKVNEIVFKL